MLSKLKRYAEEEIADGVTDGVFDEGTQFYLASEVDAHLEESEKAVKSLVEAARRLASESLVELDLIMKHHYCLVCRHEWYETETHYPDCALIALRESLKAWEKA